MAQHQVRTMSNWYEKITQTERYEQEVTINLEQEIGVGEQEGGVQTELIAQYEETVRKQINLEISSFFMDYGFHVLSQLAAILVVSGLRFLNYGNQLGYGVVALFGGQIFTLLIRLIKRKSDSNIKKYIIALELLSSSCIIGSVFTLQSQVFCIPLIILSVVILAQVIFYCLNFADSIDQTFVFKLVL